MPSTESVSHDDLVVCSCENREYKARDAIDAAFFRGELQADWNEFLKRIAAEKQADATDMDFDENVLDSAAEQFRYDHDLITAEETEQWLSTRGLTLDDFSDYFARQYCGNVLGNEVTPESISYPSASSDLRQLFATESILSGNLERMTKELVWRLASRTAAKEDDPELIAAEEQKFFDRHSLGREHLPNWLATLGRDAEWFSEMLAMEAAYRKRRDSLLADHARQHEMATLRLPLTRFETEMIELESRDAAQEALFCVREDGMSMEEVAIEGRYPYRRTDFLLEDVAPDMQQKFLSVSPGDILEPFARGDGFELCRILNKVEPKASDPAVQWRIEQRILERHFSDLSSKHVDRRMSMPTAS